MSETKTLILFALVLTAICIAAPAPYFHADGTTHWFEVIEIPGGVDWSTAQDSAFALGGYLATVTSPDENAFLFALLDSNIYWDDVGGFAIGPWIGGLQPYGSTEPDGGWEWISGESFGYDNWSPGEPNNEGGANRIHFGGEGWSPIPTWNDLPRVESSPKAFIAEFSDSSQTLGLFLNDEDSYDGYTLFAPIGYDHAYIIDNQGRIVHAWNCGYQPGQSCYLLENGHLLYTARVPSGNPIFGGGGSGGMVMEFDWDGTQIWRYVVNDSTQMQHHDVEYMPSGNILIVAWEYRSYIQCIAAGRDPSLLADGELWPDKIIEVEPIYPDSGRVVWEWHAWDHIIQDYDSSKDNYGVVADNPGKIDLNYHIGPSPAADWLHVNSIDYNPELDQIVLSIHNTHELWVIDHSTADYSDPSVGIDSAAGPAGDLLYRWGNPAVYDRGFPADRIFYGQHDAQWIEPGLPGEGDLLVFNNGIGNFPPPFHSSIDQLTPPVDAFGNYSYTPGTAYEPASLTWMFTATPETSFYSANISGCQRLPNGNTLICEGAAGTLFEVTDAGEIVWYYVNPVNEDGRHYQGEVLPNNNVFRCYRYGTDYSAFTGRDLTPSGTLELYEGMAISENRSASIPDDFKISAHPNPFNSAVNITVEQTFLSVQDATDANQTVMSGLPIEIEIYDATGRMIDKLSIGNGSPDPSTKGQEYISPTQILWRPDATIPSGVYLIRARIPQHKGVQPIVATRRLVYLK